VVFSFSQNVRYHKLRLDSTYFLGGCLSAVPHSSSSSTIKANEGRVDYADFQSLECHSRVQGGEGA
jgi:hypothetical protein